MKTCPACDGPGLPLGPLGTLHWFRCRNCGLTFSSQRAPKIPRRTLDTPRQTSTNDPQTKNPQTKNLDQ